MKIIKDGNIICPHCGERMIWQDDFDLEDVGYTEKGIGAMYICPECGTSVEINVPEKEET